MVVVIAWNLSRLRPSSDWHLTQGTLTHPRMVVFRTYRDQRGFNTQAWLAGKWTIWRCIFLEKGGFSSLNHATVWLPEGDISHRKKFPWPLFSDAFRIGPGRLGTGDGEFEGPSAVQSEPSEHLDFATRNQIGRNFQGLRTAAVLSYTYQTNLEVTRGHFQTKPMNLEGVRGWINIPFFMPKCSIAMRILWTHPLSVISPGSHFPSWFMLVVSMSLVWGALPLGCWAHKRNVERRWEVVLQHIIIH